MEEEKMKSLKVGRWGGEGGSFWDDGTFSGVLEIRLEFNELIDSILVVYDKQGLPFNAQKHGGHGGKNTASIKLEYPEEFLIGISGHYGHLDGKHGDEHHYIRSLTFKSNRREFGPYGIEYGKRFTFSSHPLQQIVGFFGNSGSLLDSIGLHLSHAKPRALLQNILQVKQGWPEKSLVVGPWGGDGGSNWDDGIFSGIRSITLVYCGCIDSIAVVYDDHGLPFKAEKHGGKGGNKTAEIILQHPSEFLIGVSGYYGPVEVEGEDGEYIRSLTFKTNHRTFGPFGVEEGSHFTLDTNGRRVLGLKGRSDLDAYLDAIAFHLSEAVYNEVLLEDHMMLPAT